MKYFIFLIATLGAFLSLKPCLKDDSEILPLCPLTAALYTNLKHGISISKKPNKLVPRVTSISYSSCFDKCTCSIDFFIKQAHVGHITFTCDLTSNPQVRSVYINLICTATNVRHQGIGKLIMHGLLNTLQKVAHKTKTSFVFYLLSSEVRKPPKWVGDTSLTRSEQQKIRNKFYTGLGLTESTAELYWDEKLSFRIFGEPSNFGTYFYTDKNHVLPAEFESYKFGATYLSTQPNEEKNVPKHFKTFYTQLELYLHPFFLTDKHSTKTVFYPHIKEKFSLKKNAQKSFLISANYFITTRTPTGIWNVVSLLKASRASSNTTWNTIQENGSGDLWLNILQKTFISALKSPQKQNNSLKS
ncbi:TPA: hypothetical protein DDZ86_01015 [Candidatus Dependentiae bacterium]|nr:MAG: hypothetical protein UW09_C0004G0085 [candidate division TM6 bacterium GW2011_GWF2_43_87]HBL98206.1 hypothetical protein [Candidatus Dependentiae bacterium]